MNDENKIDILGYASAPSRGVKRGIIMNPDEFGLVANDVITQVENQFNGRLGEMDVAISGQHVRMLTHKGYRFLNETGKVTANDIDILRKESESINPGPGNKIFHSIPGLFTVDDESGIRHPVGYSGKRIEGIFNLVTAPESYESTINEVFERISISVGNIVIAPVVASEAVLTPEEKEEGVVLVDIGAGTTKLAVYYEGALVHVSVFPFAGYTITNDIREGCSILFRWAEQLKVQYGQALGDFAEEEKVVTIPGSNGWEPKEISFKTLAYIIQARIEEIIDGVYNQIEQSGYLGKIGAGIVLTGGTSSLPNIVQLVKYRTGLDVRPGSSLLHLKQKIKGLNNPGNMTLLGLLYNSLTNNRYSEVRPVTKRFFDIVKGKVSQINIIFDSEDLEMR